MDKLVIEGGARLKGRVNISGAKNGCLAIMPACLLTPGVFNLSNTPNLTDVWSMSRLLNSMGAHSELNGNTLFLDTREVNSWEAPYEFVKTMRASFYVLGPLLARFGKAKVSLPGGCAWGPRPVDLHLKGLQKLGVTIEIENGYIEADATNLVGGRFNFDISSVGATGNVLMAAVKAKGSTLLTNAAIEPEITALARFLVKMGAKIDGIGTTQLEIEGVDDLKAVDEEIVPDRIEAATFMIAAAMTKGDVELTNVNPYHIAAVIGRMEETGATIDVNANTVRVTMDEEIKPVDITTSVYPGIPTDIQAQWTAYMLAANGTSKVVDTIYTDRFKHIPELQRLGADISIADNTAIIKGGKQLSGATVMSSDLRASASLILSGLIAEGRTEVLRVYHLDRGYEKIEQKLLALGANIKREKADLV
ncbi:UDP-N-acetylglucosamine 1-carboxyvinyltransferase [bacterium]|nr:MAG: UDP-N-acetylglucosamine 1-carboxyvinyltransferase [bacterium]